MSKYRPVDVRLWNDRKFMSLSNDGKLLWLFLLTTPSTLPIPGVVVGGEAALAEQLQWLPERFRERFNELTRKGLAAHREGRLIWLSNALKYQPPANPNMVIGWSKCWDDIPESNLKHDIWQALGIACKSWSRLFNKLYAEPFRDGPGNGSDNGSGNGSTQDQDQDQEQKQDQDLEENTALADGSAFSLSPSKKPKRKPKPNEVSADEMATVREVLEKLGTYSGVSYTGNSKQAQLILAHLRNGITVSDMQKVAGYCALELGWKGNPKMHQYLRPKTLYGPEKLYEYLDEARAWYASLENDRDIKPANGTSLDDAELEPHWMDGGDS